MISSLISYRFGHGNQGQKSWDKNRKRLLRDLPQKKTKKKASVATAEEISIDAAAVARV